MGRMIRSYAGKKIARSLTHTAMQLLAPTCYNGPNSHHLYLSGPEAGDLKEAYVRGVSSEFLHAVERGDREYEEACRQSGTLCSRITHSDIGDYAEVASSCGIDFSVIFADWCNKTEKAVELTANLLPYLKRGGIIAINSTYGHSLGKERDGMMWCLSSEYREQKYVRGLANALLMQTMFEELKIPLYFPLAITYRNLPETWDGAPRVPMLTVVGWLARSRIELPEPTYYVSVENYDGGLKVVESSTNSNRAFKAHLPVGFKNWIKSL